MSRVNGHKVGYFEIPSDDVECLKDFYSSLFGWQFEKKSNTRILKDKNAGISGSFMQKENPEQISTMFIEEESIENYTDKANELGAKAVKNKQEISEGLLCSFRRSSRKHVWCLAE